MFAIKDEQIAGATFVERLKAFDDDAWRTLFTRYASRLENDIGVSLRRRALSDSMVEDIAQETWNVAAAKIHTYNDATADKLYHWLRTISFNLLRNHARKARPVLSIDTLYEDGYRSDAAREPWLSTRHDRHDSTPVEEVVILREQYVLAVQVLNQLKPRDREIVIRRYLWQQMPAEIAEDFPGLQSRSVSQLLSRVRKRLAAALDDDVL